MEMDVKLRDGQISASSVVKFLINTFFANKANYPTSIDPKNPNKDCEFNLCKEPAVIA